jgi:cupin 2 domain-containing protein
MSSNLLSASVNTSAEEQVTELVSGPGVRVERIVSSGHTSPPGFWYDQPWAEWVAVLQGDAELMIEGDSVPIRLRTGDHVLLPAGRRHRVERTSVSPPTIWLAVHFAPTARRD